MTATTDSGEPSAADPLDFDRLWNYSDPAATEQKFRKLQPEVAAQSRARELELLTQIARTLGLQRRFEEAHQLLDVIEDEALAASPLVQQRFLLERGRVFNSAGQPEHSRPLFLAAWELRQNGGDDHYSVDAAHMLGIIESEEEAIRWNRLAMELAEQSDHPRAGGWLGALYNNLGWTYHDRGDFEQALELFERGVVWREAREPEAPKRIARWTVARTLRSLGRTEEALARQQQLLEDYTAAGQRSGYVFEELAECHLLLGQQEKAREFFAEAWKELSQDEWLQTAEPDRLARLRELGGLAGVDGRTSP